MNKDNAKQFLPLVQALAAGKTIQIKTFGSDGWDDLTSPSFAFEPGNYRVKPEPAYTFKYRRYIYKSGTGNGFVNMLQESSGCTPKQLEQQSFFGGWIDTEWQRHEVPGGV